MLDAPAATYLPALRSLVAATKDSPPITVRHLLTMTSGLGYDDQWGAVTFGKSDAELAAFLARGMCSTAATSPGRRLAKLHGNYGSCALEAALSSDGKGQSSFNLRCAEGPLELTLRLDPKTSLLADFSGVQPRPFGAVCAE